MIRKFFGKYWLSIMAGFMAFFTPLREVFLFVGILVMADWITGIAKGLKTNTLSNFTLDKMHEKFVNIMDTYVKAQPKLVPFNVPKVNSSKMQIPKLNKIN